MRKQPMKALQFSTLFLVISLMFYACGSGVLERIPEQYGPMVSSALEKAGDNRGQIEEFLSSVPEKQVPAASFLIAYMPERDLTSLTTAFLSENLDYAFKVRDALSWQKTIPDTVFLNYVLPYVNMHERRDNWRGDFYKTFYPLVQKTGSISDAVLLLNQSIWDMVGVHYSTKRPKADQSPYESIEAGMASCTGLSILMVDVCRAVGIPARFVGVPLWSDHSGNHSWVEIWDNGWHFVGAAEPGPLNDTWFAQRAAFANNSDWKYQIYAVSYKKTDLNFPVLWDSTADYVYAQNLTSKYQSDPLAEGKVIVRVKVTDKQTGERIRTNVEVHSGKDKIGQGRSRSERFDKNDVLSFHLEPDTWYRIDVKSKDGSVIKKYRTNTDTEQLVEIVL